MFFANHETTLTVTSSNPVYLSVSNTEAMSEETTVSHLQLSDDEIQERVSE